MSTTCYTIADMLKQPDYGVPFREKRDSFELYKIPYFPMSHFHYDRFDTPDDEQYGKFSVNFRTGPQGDVDQGVISLDQAEVVFTRRPETLDPKLLEKLAGTYLTPSKVKFEVLYQPGTGLALALP